MTEINWTKFPGHTNFKCKIQNTGKWKDGTGFGKWLCLFEPNGSNNSFGKIITVSTYSDLYNLITAMMEVERRNDAENHIYPSGPRPKEKRKKLNLINTICYNIAVEWLGDKE